MSTAQVVDLKMSPIGAAVALTGSQFTPQAAMNQWEEFRAATRDGGSAVAKAIINTVVQARNATAKEFALATSGVVESTRFTVDNKRVDSNETALARKFQSYTRAAFGAVINGLISLEEVQAYSNSQALYDDARKLLSECAIDWTGTSDAEKAAAKAKKANSKAVNDAAEELGIDSGSILEMGRDELELLREKAAEKLSQAQAKAKLEALERKAKALVKSLEGLSMDDAFSVLNRAQAIIAASVAV